MSTPIDPIIDELATMRNDISAIADRLAEIKATLPSWYSDQLDLPLSHVNESAHRLSFVIATFKVETSAPRPLVPQEGPTDV